VHKEVGWGLEVEGKGVLVREPAKDVLPSDFPLVCKLQEEARKRWQKRHARALARNGGT